MNTPQAESSERLPFVRIDVSPGIPEPLEAARNIVAMMFDLEAPSPEVAERFEMSVSFYDLGPLQMSTCVSSGSILHRTAARIALTRTDHFIVHFYRTGGFHMTTDGTRVAVPPGSLSFFDLSRPGKIEADRVDNLALTIPPDLLLPLVADPHSIHGLVLRPDSEANVALTLHMEDLWQRLPDMTPQRADTECQSLVAALAAAIGAQTNTRSMARAHLRRNQFSAICRWIDENLGDPTLSPAAVTQKFWITRPTLYRMFEKRGGIMKYIQQRRMEKVFHDLVDATLHHERIGEIMYRRGLHEQTVAGRAFRAYFGLTPRQVRANVSATIRISHAASTETFRIQNMERLGPLLEKHNVQVTMDNRGRGLAIREYDEA